MSAAAPDQTGTAPEPTTQATESAPPAPSRPTKFYTPPGTPPKDESAAPAAPPAAAPPPPLPGWASAMQLDEERASFVASKSWKSADDMVKSLAALERMKGVPGEQIMRKPDWSKEESVAEYRKALGVPEAPDGYGALEVKIPGGVLDTEPLSKLAHSIHLDPSQYRGLVEGTGELLHEIFAAEQQRIATEQAASLAGLDKEWGPMKAENEQNVERAVAAFMTEEEYDLLKLSGLGEAGLKRVLSRLGAKLAEHKPAGGAGNEIEPRTPQWAEREMSTLAADQGFMAKLAQNDKDALDRWNTLLTVAYGAT